MENEIIAEYSVTTDGEYHTVNASVTNLGTNVIIIAGYDNDDRLKSVILDQTEAKFETSLGIYVWLEWGVLTILEPAYHLTFPIWLQL